MSKADLIDSLATDFELSKRQTGEVIDALLDEIKAALRAGDKVQLIPFGSFMVRDRKRREGRNPKTGEQIVIAATRACVFRREGLVRRGRRREEKVARETWRKDGYEKALINGLLSPDFWLQAIAFGF